MMIYFLGIPHANRPSVMLEEMAKSDEEKVTGSC
jgi:hypothetical protein